MDIDIDRANLIEGDREIMKMNSKIIMASAIAIMGISSVTGMTSSHNGNVVYARVQLVTIRLRWLRIPVSLIAKERNNRL